MTVSPSLPLMLLVASMLAAGEPSMRGDRASVESLSSNDSTPRLSAFLVGDWVCRGGTPAGRIMSARVSFRRVLGDHWLEFTHVDDAPGRYRARALWPLDSSSTPVAMITYDNFGGARRFVASGWQADSIVWLRDLQEQGARAESFTFREIAGDSYHYAWRVARTPGTPMVLGDSATCHRASGAPPG